MKNITRRGFLQLTAATALVCAAAPLTGCGKKNKKELIIGTWYRQGSDDLAFTIYDDGTCMIDNDYGKGTLSIANEDQFTLTGFYGNSEIFTIIAIDKKSVTFGPPNADKNTDQTIVFWHTAEDAKKNAG